MLYSYTMKKSLIETNPHLKDPMKRREMLERSVLSSSAIEGIRITVEELRRFRGKVAGGGARNH